MEGAAGDAGQRLDFDLAAKSPPYDWNCLIAIEHHTNIVRYPKTAKTAETRFLRLTAVCFLSGPSIQFFDLGLGVCARSYELSSRLTDDADLEEVYNTERQLLYVACTRARDHLLVTAVTPASEFLDDLR